VQLESLKELALHTLDQVEVVSNHRDLGLQHVQVVPIWKVELTQVPDCRGAVGGPTVLVDREAVKLLRQVLVEGAYERPER